MRVVGVYPSRMMAVTFTNKASKEMRERVFDLVGEDTERLTLGTFHAICVRILRTSGEPIGLDRNLVIYDEDDKASIIKQAMQDLNIDPRNFPPRGIKLGHLGIQEPDDRRPGPPPSRPQLFRRGRGSRSFSATRPFSKRTTAWTSTTCFSRQSNSSTAPRDP